jgi:hypothetical protein
VTLSEEIANLRRTFTTDTVNDSAVRWVCDYLERTVLTEENALLARKEAELEALKALLRTNLESWRGVRDHIEDSEVGVDRDDGEQVLRDGETSCESSRSDARVLIDRIEAALREAKEG